MTAAVRFFPVLRSRVTHTGRNTSQSTISNDTGNYAIPALNPGTYSLSAELTGFKKFLHEGLVLQVNQVARIDLSLEVGQIAETVQVSASAPLLETDSSSRGSVIDQKKDCRPPSQRTRLQPAGAAFPRSAARNAPTGRGEFQGGT